MARPIRIEFPGAVYHITARGNAKQGIFLGDRDYRSFFSIFADVSAECDWRCYAYCLMPNHYHLVLTTPTGVLSRGMKLLNAVYAQRFHRRHDSAGHVFQGRFKSMLVDKEPYLLEVCRYVVLNPVRARLVEKCEEWPWSSYRATLGIDPKPSFLDSHLLLDRFGDKEGKARRAFAEFVEGGRSARSPWERLRGGVFLGDEAFVSRFSKQLAARRGDRAFPHTQRRADRPSLGEIFTDTEDDALRGRQVLDAQRLWGYRVAEISEHLGLHRNTVAGIVRRALRRESRDA